LKAKVNQIQKWHYLKHIEIEPSYFWAGILKGTLKDSKTVPLVKVGRNHMAANEIGERIFLDVSSLEEQQNSVMIESIKKQYWRIMMNEKSQTKINDFLIIRGYDWANLWEFFKLKSQGNPIKYICFDDNGENGVLMNPLQGFDWKVTFQFEFTGRDTSQRNYLAEVKFSTIDDCARTMMSKTYLHGLTPIEIKNKKINIIWALERTITTFHK
jgi:hypothetical protein